MVRALRITAALIATALAGVVAPAQAQDYPSRAVTLVVPFSAGTPKPIVDKINAALRALLDAPEVQQRIAGDGGDPMPSSPEEYAAEIDREETKWSALIKRLGLKVE